MKRAPSNKEHPYKQQNGTIIDGAICVVGGEVNIERFIDLAIYCINAAR